MASEINTYAVRITGVAAVDLSAKQFLFVKPAGTTNTLGVDVTPCTGITDLPIGVLQDTPAAGDLGGVCVSGISKVRVNASTGITVGNVLGIDNTGAVKAIAYGTDTTQYVVGKALETAAAGSIAQIYVSLLGPAK